MLAITTTLEHIDHWTKMRQSLPRFCGPVSSMQSRSCSDCIASTCGFRLSAHPGHATMLTKQTKESTEAELNYSDVERIAIQLKEVARDAEIVEKDLCALEDELGIPEFARSLPLPERMTAVGLSCAGIGRLSTLLDALEMVRQG